MKNLAILFIFIFIPLSLFPQMPDWKFFKDREGNAYYIDKAGKIRIIDSYDNVYKIISPKSIDYYINYGVELIKSDKINGLTILKSILALPETNNRIIIAKGRASKIINRLIKSEGSRYNKYDNASSLILFKINDDINIINGKMRYQVIIPSHVKILNRKERKHKDYKYFGILIGINNNKKEENKIFDILFAVDSEKFSRRIKNLNLLEKNWRNNLGYDTFNRKLVEKNNTKIIYKLNNKIKPYLTGIEAIIINNNYGYFLRIVSSNKKYKDNKHLMNLIISNFKFITMN